MHEFVKWHREALGEKVVNALTKNNFTATFVHAKQDAAKLLLDLIPDKATIGFGGSVTLAELDIIPQLESRGNNVLNYTKPGLSPQEVKAIRRQHALADVYLTGTNAVTLDGKLVNVDATGNRVGTMLFGPDTVFVIVGLNKVVTDVAEAEKRIKLWAAPPNNKRLNYPNPCTKTGVCVDCQSPTRICNITTIIHKCPRLTNYHVIVVGEELGL